MAVGTDHRWMYSRLGSLHGRFSLPSLNSFFLLSPTINHKLRRESRNDQQAADSERDHAKHRLLNLARGVHTLRANETYVPTQQRQNYSQEDHFFLQWMMWPLNGRRFFGRTQNTIMRSKFSNPSHRASASHSDLSSRFPSIVIQNSESFLVIVISSTPTHGTRIRSLAPGWRRPVYRCRVSPTHAVFFRTARIVCVFFPERISGTNRGWKL